MPLSIPVSVGLYRDLNAIEVPIFITHRTPIKSIALVPEPAELYQPNFCTARSGQSVPQAARSEKQR